MKGMKDLDKAALALDAQDAVVPGDGQDRQTFYDHQFCGEIIVDGKPVKLIVGTNVKLPWYGKGYHRRRMPITIPVKLRENMRTLLGVETDDDYAVTTTLVALADYACKVLDEQDKTLKVTQVKHVKSPVTRTKASQSRGD